MHGGVMALDLVKHSMFDLNTYNYVTLTLQHIALTPFTLDIDMYNNNNIFTLLSYL